MTSSEDHQGSPDTTALALGIAPDRRPSEAMIRRLLQAMDPQLLTTAIGVWLARDSNRPLALLGIT